VRVVGETPSSPSIPFVTSIATPSSIVPILRNALHRVATDPRYAAARAGLMISGVEDVPDGAYRGLLDYDARDLLIPECIAEPPLAVGDRSGVGFALNRSKKGSTHINLSINHFCAFSSFVTLPECQPWPGSPAIISSACQGSADITTALSGGRSVVLCEFRHFPKTGDDAGEQSTAATRCQSQRFFEQPGLDQQARRCGRGCLFDLSLDLKQRVEKPHRAFEGCCVARRLLHFGITPGAWWERGHDMIGCPASRRSSSAARSM
jgi:hypothetical protein